VVAHTAELVHRRRASGRPTELLTWARTYPGLLHPGTSPARGRVPDVRPVEDAPTPLRWDRPWTWRAAGRAAARMAGMVVVVHVMAVQAPALRAVVAGARAERPDVRVVVLAHNVLPHERHPGDRALVGGLLRAADGVLVHTGPQARLARDLGAPRVATAALPPHPPGSPAVRARPVGHRSPDGLRALFFGQVRRYKGVDLLLDAVAQVPGVRLTVAGEPWGRHGTRLRERLAEDPSLRERVLLREEYVPADQVGPLLAAHDVVVLPYLSGSGSQNADLAFAHGLPVLASDVPAFAARVRHGVDGLVVPRGDTQALVGALTGLSRGALLRRLAAGVVPPDADASWDRYLAALDRCGAAPAVDAVPHRG
jgi:glycosyltransferase involved in cell wall biosynthesis